MDSHTIGAIPTDAGTTTFAVWAPFARSVEVHLLDSGARVELGRARDGYFIADTDCATDETYWVVLDGEKRRPDPASRSQPDGVHGPSQVVDLRQFRWSEDGFEASPLRDNVLYELHVGTFSQGGTFASTVDQLDALVDLGITAIELMPVAQFPGVRNWGYDGVFPFAVQQSYGGPRELQNLVNECHRRGLAVVLDVVYNHLGPEGNVLPDFGPYLTDRYRTPWGHAINFDGPDSDAVRSFFVANARQWFLDFHIDGLRLDAVHEFMDRSPTPFLTDLASAAVDASESSGRPCWLIAESASNDPRTVTPIAAGGLGMDAQWSDDFHHSLHVAMTSERFGYYADYTGVPDIAEAMTRGFVYQGQYSRFRRHRHGASSASIDPSRFVVFDQNHDQVGNRPDGARLSSLIPFDRLALVAALLLLAPGLPLLFMGEEYGETAPFTYFVDHGDPDLLEAVRRGRAAEHEGTGEPLDPVDQATFDRSVLNHSLRFDEPHRTLWDLYRSLLALRAGEPALRRSSREHTRAEALGPLVVLTRTHLTTMIAAYFNLSDSTQSVQLPEASCWKELLTEGAPSTLPTIDLAPWGFRAFKTQVTGEDAE